MAHVIQLDTHQYVKELITAGVPNKQAEVQVALVKKQTDEINKLIGDNIATKEDINGFKEDINGFKKDIEITIYRSTFALIILVPTVIKILERVRF